MTTQVRNNEMVDILRPDFFARYEPNASMVHAGLHFQLPFLRAYWPMSSKDENGDIYDLSGQGRVLTNNNACSQSYYNLFPYMNFTPGSNQYLSRPDEAGLDITTGITIGGWFRLDTLAPGVNSGIIGKWDTSGGANQRAYLIWFNDANNTFNFNVSSLGTAVTVNTVTHTATLSANVWYHVVGRMNPSTEQSIFVDGVEVSTAVGVPATIFDSTADFEIGASDAGTSLMDGQASQCFLCSWHLSDVLVKTIYEQTRANFGK